MKKLAPYELYSINHHEHIIFVKMIDTELTLTVKIIEKVQCYIVPGGNAVWAGKSSFWIDYRFFFLL